MRRLDDSAIMMIAEELGKGYLSEECNKVLSCLDTKGELTQTNLQQETGLSYTICREAILLLTGALFLVNRPRGMAKVYKLSESGQRLIEMLKN